MYNQDGILKPYCTQFNFKVLNDLQTTVAATESIENVYLNENGDWLFYEHPDFPIVKTREDILESIPDAEETIVTETIAAIIPDEVPVVVTKKTK